MIGRRRRCRSAALIALGLLGAGLAAGRGLAQDSPNSLSASFRRAAARARGALVSIRLPDGFQVGAPYVPTRPGRFGPATAMTPFFEGDGRTPFSGLVVDADKGFILTADHPLQGISQLLVTFPDGNERPTTQIRRDPRSGLALLVVDMQGLRPSQANWGDPNRLEPGDWLIALGQPGVGDPSMSVGVFSTRRRGGGEELLETDAAITRVGAGGILVNLDGEVVGLCKLGARRSDGFEGMGHAIPADRARRVADDLARFGQVRRAYLGVTVEPLNPAMLGQRGGAAGVRVATVGPGTPAAEAGVRPGDVILSVGRRPVNGVSGVQEAVEAATIGEELPVSIDRQGQRMELKVRLRAAGPASPSRTPRPGTTVVPGPDPTRDGPGFPGPPPSGLIAPGGPPLSYSRSTGGHPGTPGP